MREEEMYQCHNERLSFGYGPLKKNLRQHLFSIIIYLVFHMYYLIAFSWQSYELVTIIYK